MSSNPAGAGGERPPGAGQVPTPPSGQPSMEAIPADKALLVFIYDYLRKKGMMRTAELLSQEAELTTEQLSACLQLVASGAAAGGPSGMQRSGFLGQVWGMLWDVMLAKGAGGGPLGSAIGSPGLSGILGQMIMTSPHAVSPPPILPQPQQQQQAQHQHEPPEVQRLRLNMAMGAVGLTGRDPASLNAAEKAAVTTAYKSMPSPQTQAMQQMQQQLMHCQNIIAQQQKQQQLMAQQYQQLVGQIQQVMTGGMGGKMVQQPMPLQPRTGPTKSPLITIDAEEAMMKYLQGTTPPPPPHQHMMQAMPSHPSTPTLLAPQPQVPYPHGAQQTAMESMAQRLAGVKRVRSESVNSLSHPTDAFLNMPDFDENVETNTVSNGNSTKSTSSSSLPLSEGSVGEKKRSDVGAELSLIRSFDQIHELRISSVHTSVDSMLIVSAGRDKKVSIFNALNQQLIGVLPVLHKERVTRARFALAGARRYLVTGSFDRSLHIWDLGLVGTPISNLPSEPLAIYKDDVGGLPASLDTSSLVDPETGSIGILASCDTEGVLIVRSIRDGSILHRRHDDSGAMVRMIGFEPNGDSHIALCVENRVEIYNWRMGQVVYTISPPDGRPVIGVSWDLGLIAITTDAACYAWVVDFGLPPAAKLTEAYTGRCVAIFNSRGVKLNAGIVIRDGDAPVDSFLTSKQSRVILVGGWKRLFVWRIDFDRISASGKRDERSLCYGVDAHDDLVAWITATTNHASHVIATGGYDNKVIMWRLDVSLESIPEGPHPVVQPVLQPAVAVHVDRPPESALSSSSSVEELAQPIDFDPISMFLNTDDL